MFPTQLILVQAVGLSSNPTHLHKEMHAFWN